jgi:hypothetical protein
MNANEMNANEMNANEMNTNKMNANEMNANEMNVINEINELFIYNEFLKDPSPTLGFSKEKTDNLIFNLFISIFNVFL